MDKALTVQPVFLPKRILSDVVRIQLAWSGWFWEPPVRPWNSMVATKSSVTDCHTVSYACTQWPTKSRVFAPVFDDLACSYKNEGSIPFTRSTLFLSNFAVFPGTVIRVSYEAARISPVFRGFHSRNRNRGSGLGVVFSQRALHGISGETRRGHDVTRHMAEKHFHACLNLLWCESFRVEV